MLILAGVTIAALTGSDSAPAKANEAKQKQDIGAAKDEVYLTAQNAQTEAYERVYVDGKQVGTDAAVEAGDASTNVGSYVKSVLHEKYPENGTTKIGLATIKATAGGEVTISTTDFEVIGDIEVKGGQLTWGEIEEAALDLNEQPRDTILSTTSKTKLKDNKGNKIVIPANFKISNENVVKDAGNNVEEGIIIEDGSQNQFVWVPVGTITKSNGDTVNIPLTKVNVSGYNEYENGQGTTYPNTKAKSISAFQTSVSTNKGFYIARYEAGVKGTSASDKNATYTITNADESTTTFYKNGTENSETHLFELSDSDANYLVSQSGAGVWNKINQLNAAKMCRNMYTSGVTSDLMNSYAWKTAITFIQACGTESNSASYASQSGKSGTSTSKPQTTGTNTLSTTSAVDKQCNIFDLAGNVREWTTESCTNSSSPCVYRGGSYNITTTTSGLYDGSTTYTARDVGFRPLLYL